MAFNDVLTALKQLLKDNLTPDNTELMSRIDKGLDNIVVEHKATETKLNETQEKLLEIVKETSFKSESEPNDPNESAQDKILSIDEAFDDALMNIESNRK